MSVAELKPRSSLCCHENSGWSVEHKRAIPTQLFSCKVAGRKAHEVFAETLGSVALS